MMKSKHILAMVLLAATFAAHANVNENTESDGSSRVNQVSNCIEKSKTIVGDAAAELSYLLQNSSFATKVVLKNSVVVSLNKFLCSKTSRGVHDNALPSYECNNEKIGPLIAKLSFDTLDSLGINSDGGHSNSEIFAKNIKCNISYNGLQDIDNSPSCTITAKWSLDCER